MGDLGRTGYVFDVLKFRKKIIDLPRKHIDSSNFKGENINVLTLGDSFSQGGDGGKNCFYQDYIASLNNFNVLNIREYKKHDKLTTMAILINSGWIDRYKPQYVLIESVERFCITSFNRNINIINTDKLENIIKFYQKNIYENKPPQVSIINTANINCIIYNLIYLFSDYAFSGVYIKQLTRDYFSGKKPRKLLFSIDDLRNIPLSTDKSVGKLNGNLNYISELLIRKNIKLYFMPVVDKYNYYYDYIVDNNLPPSVFFEKLRKLPKKYCLIDTKKLLSPNLKEGDKDIFCQDDTHWTYRASEIIFSQINF